MDERRVALLQASAIVTTLAEVGDSPETPLYLAGKFESLEAWYAMREVLITNGLITVSHNLVSITPKGRELAKKIDDAMERQGMKNEPGQKSANNNSQ